MNLFFWGANAAPRA